MYHEDSGWVVRALQMRVGCTSKTLTTCFPCVQAVTCNGVHLNAFTLKRWHQNFSIRGLYFSINALVWISHCERTPFCPWNGFPYMRGSCTFKYEWFYLVVIDVFQNVVTHLYASSIELAVMIFLCMPTAHELRCMINGFYPMAVQFISG